LVNTNFITYSSPQFSSIPTLQYKAETYLHNIKLNSMSHAPTTSGGLNLSSAARDFALLQESGNDNSVKKATELKDNVREEDLGLGLGQPDDYKMPQTPQIPTALASTSMSTLSESESESESESQSEPEALETQTSDVVVSDSNHSDTTNLSRPSQLKDGEIPSNSPSHLHSFFSYRLTPSKSWSPAFLRFQPSTCLLSLYSPESSDFSSPILTHTVSNAFPHEPSRRGVFKRKHRFDLHLLTGDIMSLSAPSKEVRSLWQFTVKEAAEGRREMLRGMLSGEGVRRVVGVLEGWASTRVKRGWAMWRLMVAKERERVWKEKEKEWSEKEREWSEKEVSWLSKERSWSSNQRSWLEKVRCLEETSSLLRSQLTANELLHRSSIFANTLSRTSQRGSHKLISAAFSRWIAVAVSLHASCIAKEEVRREVRDKILSLTVTPLQITAEASGQEMDVMEAEINALETENILRRMEQKSALGGKTEGTDSFGCTEVEPLGLRRMIEDLVVDVEREIVGEGAIRMPKEEDHPDSSFGGKEDFDCMNTTPNFHIFSDSDSDSDNDQSLHHSYVRRSVVSLEKKIRKQSSFEGGKMGVPSPVPKT